MLSKVISFSASEIASISKIILLIVYKPNVSILLTV